MDIKQTNNTKFKLVIPSIKRDLKGLMLKDFKEYIYYNEYFYFDNIVDAEHYQTLLNTDKSFIIEVKNG